MNNSGAISVGVAVALVIIINGLSYYFGWGFFYF